MATPAENIDTAIAGYAAQLATLATDPAGPYTTYQVGDQTFSWTEYQEFLVGAMKKLVDAKQATSGPFIVRARGIR